MQENFERLLVVATEKGDMRDEGYRTETHRSDPRDWTDAAGWNPHYEKVYKGSQKGWYMAPRLTDLPNWDKGEGSLAGVYVLQAKPSGWIKVGYSKDVTGRMSELQVGCPETLYLLFVVDASRSREKWIHDQISEYRTRGEWFSPDALPALECIKDNS